MAVLVLLLLATVHCVRSIFLVNVSLVDLQSYAQGTERMPFQGRVAMMPVLRWAHGSHAVQRAADFFDDSLRRTPHFAVPPEHVSAEKLTSIAVGLLATGLAVLFAVLVGRRRFGALWWLPASLFLLMLYLTYAARYEAQYWYPYDLLHIALFGMAAVCILEDRLGLAFALFVLDLPVRETAIFLVPLVLAVGYVERRKLAWVWAGLMAGLWLPVRLAIMHRFAANATEAKVHLIGFERAIANPLHWPQIASAFGFLLLPFCFGFGLLSRKERFFVYGALPSLGVIALYGIWYETRVWDEWLLPFAVLLSLEAVRKVAAMQASEQLAADEVEGAYGREGADAVAVAG